MASHEQFETTNSDFEYSKEKRQRTRSELIQQIHEFESKGGKIIQCESGKSNVSQKHQSHAMPAEISQTKEEKLNIPDSDINYYQFKNSEIRSIKNKKGEMFLLIDISRAARMNQVHFASKFNREEKTTQKIRINTANNTYSLASKSNILKALNMLGKSNTELTRELINWMEQLNNI